LTPFETDDDFFVDPIHFCISMRSSYSTVCFKARSRKIKCRKDVQVLQHGPRVDGYELQRGTLVICSN
jgi:hypothetical protein